MPTTRKKAVEPEPKIEVIETDIPKQVRIKWTEHFKVAPYSHIEIEAEASGEFDNRRGGLQTLHKDLRAYHKAARKELKQSFDDGEFEWLADVE